MPSNFSLFSGRTRRALVRAACLAPLLASSLAAQTQPAYNQYTPSSSASTGQTRAQARNPASSSLTMVPEDFSKLILAPGFLLDLEVYDMPEISSQIRVDNEGNLAVPLSGKVHVAGLTVPLAQDAIAKQLVAEKILIDPKLNLDVVQYAANNITVLGEVQSPGRLQLLASHSLGDVIALAGGETQLAGNTITISHAQKSESIHYDRNRGLGDGREIIVNPGDTVLVPRAGIVYVLGGVNRPGGYVMQEDGLFNVAEALSVAEGTTINASVGAIRILRKSTGGAMDNIPVSYKAMTKGRELPVTLKDGDILYVPISKFKTVMTAGISASASSALIYSVR